MNENNNNIADIAMYQRYLMTLKTLEEERYQEEWDNFIRRLLQMHGIEDDHDASPEALAKVDLEVAMARYPLLKEIAPNACLAVEEQITAAYPIADEMLMQAGYEDELRTDELIDHVATIHTAEQVFPEEGKLSLVDRLKNAKGHVKSALTSDKGSLALSTVMFSVAVGTGGGAALAISGAMYAANLMKSESVQNLMTRIEGKISDTLVRFGFKEENVEDRKITLGEKMKKIASNPWFKGATAVAAVGLIGVGVGSLLANGGMETLKDGFSDIANADYTMFLKDASVAAQNLFWSGVDSVSNAPELVASAYESITQSATEIGASLSGSVDQALLAAESTANEVYEQATNLVSGESPQPLAEGDTTAPKYTLEELTPEVEPEVVSDTAAGNTSEIQGDTTEPVDASPNGAVVPYEVKEGDNAWNIAKEYLESVSGSTPTDAQIDALVDDLDLENPDLIYPGDIIELPADTQQYGVSPQDAFVAEPPPEFDGVEMAGVPAELDISRYFDFGEILKVHGLHETMTLAEVQQMNPDLNFWNLSPGDSMVLDPNGDVVYTVPSVGQMILETSFPNGVPDHFDTNQYVKDVMALNEHHNLKEGWFGVQILNGNPLMGQEILENGVLKTPDVDLGALTPTEQSQTSVSGRNVAGNLDRDILSSAFPDGAPKYLDEKAFIDSVKEMNPGLSLVHEGDHYSESVTIPGTQTPETTKQIVDGFDKDNAISSFRDRFASLHQTGPNLG